MRLPDSSIIAVMDLSLPTISYSHDDFHHVINTLDQIPPVVARCTVHVSVQREL